MGAAIASFPGAAGAARPALALPAGEDDRRPARRCAPTPTCSTSARTSWRRRPAATAAPPLVRLDPAWYRLVDDFDARFPARPAVARGLRRADGRGRRALRARRRRARDRHRRRRTATRRAVVADGARAGGVTGAVVRARSPRCCSPLPRSLPGVAGARPAPDADARATRSPALTPRQLAGQRIIVGYAGAARPGLAAARACAAARSAASSRSRRNVPSRGALAAQMRRLQRARAPARRRRC